MRTTCEKSWSAFCYPLLAYYFNIKILKTKDLEFSNFEPRSIFLDRRILVQTWHIF